MTQPTQILIAGAGPVGLTLAIDLAWRGISSATVEPVPPANPQRGMQLR
jgi:2-polyprenyl-6-methoxyphenol hydroxylase-like FAD-dependent oxidoreductase